MPKRETYDAQICGDCLYGATYAEPTGPATPAGLTIVWCVDDDCESGFSWRGCDWCANGLGNDVHDVQYWIE